MDITGSHPRAKANVNRRDFFSLAAAAAAASQPSTAQTRQPNILHIMTDQQQWATVAGRSLCRTPNSDRLASQGMQFASSCTPSAVCCPARAMLLSGAYHWHNGVYNQIHSSPSVHRDMNPGVVLYAHRLRDAGYRLGYTGKWHASWVRTPADFGYEMAGVYGCDPAALLKYDLNPDRVEKPAGSQRRTVLRNMQWPGSAPFPMWGYTEGPEEGTSEWQTAEAAIRMMKRFAQDSRPWLLESHFIAPHDPYFPLKQFYDRYDPRQIPVPNSFHDTFAGKPGLHKRESASWGNVTEDDYRRSRACYFAQAEQVDAQIGRILSALDETGQAANTLVAITSDHGDMCGAHRMWIKGWIPYQESYKVPLIVRWPGVVKPGSETKRLVLTHDLAHTYVAAAGAAALPYADGFALQALFTDPPGPWPDQRMCAYYGGEFLYTQRIALTERFKYVFNGFDIDEMYDLVNDPEEMRNVADDPAHHAQADDMRARLYEMMDQFEDPYGTPQRWTLPGNRPDRYGAPRYLSRGKRLATG